MREILFRGKRLDHGVWEEGYYSPKDLPSYDAEPVDMPCIIREEDLLWCKVDPATVGQYTGLKDKNGKKIFEGDVVRFTERQLGGKDVPVVEAVEFSEGGFATHRYFLNNWLRNAAKGNCQLEDIEVIGNIHDNPGLLEGDLP